MAVPHSQKKPAPITIVAALQAKAEDDAIWCVDCGNAIEEHIPGERCRSCNDYWQDVINGLFL